MVTGPTAMPQDPKIGRSAWAPRPDPPLRSQQARLLPGLAPKHSEHGSRIPVRAERLDLALVIHLDDIDALERD